MEDPRLAGGNYTSKEERVSILAKYDKGRADDAVIEDWEDPDFSVYKSTDRYGFMHKQKLPDVLVPPKVVELERERSLKWGKMLRNWEKFHGSETLYKRIYKGIPNSVRGQVWKKFLHIHEIRESGVYDQMKRLAREISPDIKQIDLDVHRTFRDHVMFRERYNIKQQALFHLLAAYSMYNEKLGYCQGMSSLAALLLTYLNEEDAFWGMVTLIGDQKYAMHGFFIPGLPKLFACCDMHSRGRQRLLPKLDKHFKKHSVEPSHYCTPWFFKLFLECLPFSLTLRIWDALLLEGEKVLLSACLAVLKVNQKILLSGGEDHVREFLQELKTANLNEEDMIAELQSTMTDLAKAGLAIPPQVAQLEDIKKLNRLALEKAHQHLPDNVPNGITATIANGTKVENSVPILYGSETTL